MNIALVYWGSHRRGGAERVVFEVSQFLALQKHIVHVYALDWEEPASLPNGISIVYHRVPVISKPGLLRSLSFFINSTRMVRQHQHDVLNSHGVFCPLGGVHWTHSVHRAWLERSKQLHSSLSVNGLRRKLNPQHQLILQQEKRHFVDGYRRIITVSDQVAIDLNRLYHTPRTDMQVINNGLDPKEFNPQRRLSRRGEERAKLGIRETDTVMLMVANELERKGLPTLLTAMQQLGRSDLKLIIAGRAAYQSYLPKVAAMGLSENILFLGSSTDVGAFHAAADFFVLPTQYEAFCLAILEALGSGLPVLTTTVPGAGDTIQPGVNGLLLQNPRDSVELAGHISAMLDGTVRKQMQLAAAPSVEAYHWGNVLKQCEKVLLSAANDRS